MFSTIKKWLGIEKEEKVTEKVTYDEHVVELYKEYRKKSRLLIETSNLLDDSMERLEKINKEAERLAASNRKLRKENSELIVERDGLKKSNRTLTLLLKDVYGELKKLTSKKSDYNEIDTFKKRNCQNTNNVIENYETRVNEAKKEKELEELKEELEEKKKPLTLEEVRERLNSLDLRA